MKIVSITSAVIPEVKVVRFARFRDERGYFCEPFRASDAAGQPGLEALARTGIRQVNESFSRSGVVRGLHFQWHPFMGKLVRTLSGRMLDIVLDIRRDSPSLGRALLFDVPAAPEADETDWIWVPPGFAHGNAFIGDTQIEYFCTGEYSPGNEAAISPFAADIDWTLADPRLCAEFTRLRAAGALLSAKDRDGLTVGAWLADPRSGNFIYGSC
jgi:dTDP-4-dehydrorhamnose 3,5-epimerase